MRLRKLFAAIVGLCSSYAATPATDASTSLHLDWLDSSVQPSQNFFAYANGTWQKQNPIPPEYEAWGAFHILNEKVQNTIHQMLIAAANDRQAKPGSIEQKVGDFYYSGMNEALINKVGVSPLKPEFDRIAAINSESELQGVIAHLQQIGVDVLFGFGSMQDFKNSNEMIGAAIQGGLGLPDRDYYLKDDKKFADIRQAYVNHIQKMFVLLGDKADVAAKEAQQVMAFETTLAKASLSQIELRDPYAIYHPMDEKQLQAATPHFSWSRYFVDIGLPQLKSINLATPEFFKTVNEQLTALSLEDWKTYLRWHLIDSFASYLSKPFVDENFRMVSAINGAEKQLPRWKRVVKTENGALGFAIGKMYVEKYFSPESKQKVLEIVQNIRQALKQDLQSLSWMTPATRQAALKKLDLMEERVGYPEKWWDYSSLKIDRGPYVLNVIRASEFLVKRDLNKIGKPVDRTEWQMTPQTINAYYDPSMNNINLPAGILQTPFFDPKAPAAVNYGAIGFIIGHEMTHGFDDKGALFDGHGNLNNWWSPEDLKKFQAATNCISEQFSHYKVNGDLSVQGNLVVGEATADLGGLTLAYHAFHASKDYKDAKTITGFTPDQQFFLGSAHIWASNIRPEQARNMVTTDPHPPMTYRVNGTLANMPQFQAAFNLPENCPMVNKNRCVIW
ncbi:M13 family peptidase [Legionella jordanis]|uniref:M13 family metallopeptidase n=1 Tax=Legionella jordanis TaxID=456 RepID=UPI000EFF7995|nr:M13 family metallopeptidase [Legionella jordanis]RMX20798.1 M13 family peptidase [Legionella jordanis]